MVWQSALEDWAKEQKGLVPTPRSRRIEKHSTQDLAI
jgi:hypothetical protein